MPTLQNRNALRRALPMLPLTKAESKVVLTILEQGRGNTWTLMHGADLGRRMGTLITGSRTTAFRAIAALEARGLLYRDRDEHHRTTLTMTDRLFEGAELVLQRKRIETLVGSRDWALMSGDAALADEIHALARPDHRYRDEVRRVAKVLLRERHNWGDHDNSPDYGGHRKRNVVELRSPRSGTQSRRNGTQSRRNDTQKVRSTR